MFRGQSVGNDGGKSLYARLCSYAFCGGLAAAMGVAPMVLGTLGAATVLVGCEEQGDFEEAGEEVDDELDDLTSE